MVNIVDIFKELLRWEECHKEDGELYVKENKHLQNLAIFFRLSHLQSHDWSLSSPNLNPIQAVTGQPVHVTNT